jgi:hypothetical protein
MRVDVRARRENVGSDQSIAYSVVRGDRNNSHLEDGLMSAAAKRHMARVAQMDCVCCRLLGQRQESKTDCHHIREDREERNDWLTIPLCHASCHMGRLGVHGDKTYLRILKVSEWGLLAVVIKDLETVCDANA